MVGRDADIAAMNWVIANMQCNDVARLPQGRQQKSVIEC
jgi:hypothetical protein